MRQGPRGPAGITAPSPSTRSLPLAWLGEGSVALKPRALAVAVPSGLRGRPKPPRLLSPRSLRLRLSRPGSAPSSGGGARRRRRSPARRGPREYGWRPPGGSTDSRARPQPRARGRRAAHGKVPPLEQGRVPPTSPWLDNGQEVPRHHKTQQLPAGTQGCPRATRFRNPGPQRWAAGRREEPLNSGGAPGSNTASPPTDGRERARLPRRCPETQRPDPAASVLLVTWGE